MGAEGGVGMWQIIVLVAVLVLVWIIYTYIQKLISKEASVSSNTDSLLCVTDKTIKFCGQVYQLKNITQVGKYKVRKSRWAVAIVAMLMGGGGVALLAVDGAEPIGVGVMGFALILFIWNIFRKNKFLLRLETSSGSSELFTSKDEKFIEEIVENITEVMELQIEGTNIIAYTDKSKIVNNTIHKQVKGDDVSGDKFSDIKMNGSQIVNRSPHSAVTNTISEKYGEEVQRAFEDLRQHIDQHKDEGAAVIIEKVKEEIQALNPDNSRVAALWNSLVKILPDASKMASAIAVIAGVIL